MKNTLLLITLFISFTTIFGQTSTFLQFERIHTNTNASVIGCIMQDSSGMLWMGTNRGLFSYNGYSFYQHHTTETGIYESRMYCGLIHSDSIFAGTDNGLVSYNIKNGTYYNHQSNNIKDIRCMTLSGKELWIGTLNGLFRYEVTTKKIYEFSKEMLPHKAVYSIIKSDDGNIYVGTYNGLCRIDKKNNASVINLPSNNRWKNTFVNVLLEDKEKQCIWVGTEGNLFNYDINTGKTVCIPYFSDNSIKSLNYDNEKNLLIGTDNGLYIYSVDEKKYNHYIHDSRNIHSIPNNIIWCISTDKDNNIWLGTDNGVSFINNDKEYKFIPVWELSNTNDGNMFYTIMTDSKGRYWYGGTDGLLQTNIYNGKNTSRWFKVGEKESELSHNRIRHIFEDKSHNLWIATDGSIERYDEKSAKFVHYTIIDSTNTYNSNWAYHISEDSKNNLWISSCLGGLFVVGKDKLEKCNSEVCIADKNFTTNDGLESAFVKQAVPDKNDNIWVLMYNTKTLQKINSYDNKIYSYPICTEHNEYPEFIICDSDGMIWIGTNMNILKINPNSEEISKSKAKWKYDNILHMAEVDNNIWISTSKSLYYVDKSTLKTAKININDKIFSSIYYDKPNGKVLMGGYDGIGYCEPKIIDAGNNNNKIYLTALSVNNHYISNGIIANNEFVLDYKDNNLTFEFSDFCYNCYQRGGFMYMMSGIDSKWHYVNANTNMIVYNNMPHGDFDLYVKHSMDGGEGYRIASVKITPPWYLSNNAKIMYLLISIGLICWTINFFRVKNKLHIEKLEKKKIIEHAEQKIKFMSNISHDLKSPISMIVAPISKLMMDIKNQKQKEMLEIAYKNVVNLNAMIHKLIEINRIDDNKNILILSRVELVSFVNDITNNFIESEVEIVHKWNFSTDIEHLYMDMDIIKLESIFRNLISNAVKYTPSGNDISVEIRHKDENVDIQISNKGICIPDNELPYIFQRFYQSSVTKNKYEGTGIGLYLVKTYTELHNGNVYVSSDEKGTIFTVSFHIDSSINTLSDKKMYNVNEYEHQYDDKPVILITDDNKDVFDVIKNILSDSYRCIYASNGKEGLEIITKIVPNLIITDFMMPVMNGLEMCKIIRKNTPTSTIPIIMLSAKDDNEVIKSSFKSQIDAFILKPFDMEILSAKVEQLIHKNKIYETKARIENIIQPKQVQDTTSIDEKFLINITQIIEDHITDSNLNVNALCNLSGTSSKQIYRKIKQLTGISPVEYIKSIRMKKAAMLLQQKKFTIAEVMYMVGYSNPSYFSKCFQSVFGKTPKQYSSEYEE